MGGLAASFEEVAYVSKKVLQVRQANANGRGEISSNYIDSSETYHNRRVGVASSELYWLKFATGALQYFLAPEVLRAVWGPGGAAWRK